MRLNFELGNDYIDELRALQHETGSPTMKDLFTTAMTTLQILVDERKNGNKVAAVNEARRVFRVLIIPALDRVDRKGGLEREVAHSSSAAACGGLA